jgi:hypothetical protein
MSGTNAKTELVSLTIGEASTVDAGDNPGADIVMTKNKDDEKGVFSKLLDWLKKSEERTEKLEEKVETLAGETSKDGEPAETPKAKADEPKEEAVTDKASSVDDVLKALPEDHRTLIEQAIKAKTEEATEISTLKAEKDALETRLAKLEDDKLTEIFSAKAKALAIPGTDVEKLGALLKKSYLVDEEHGKAIEETLRGVAEQTKASAELFKSIGSAAPYDGDSPEGQLEAAAKKLREADPKLSYASAYVKAMDMNPKLAAQATA